MNLVSEMKIDKDTGLDELAKYQNIINDALKQMPKISFEQSEKIEKNITKRISAKEKQNMERLDINITESDKEENNG